MYSNKCSLTTYNKTKTSIDPPEREHNAHIKLLTKSISQKAGHKNVLHIC